MTAHIESWIQQIDEVTAQIRNRFGTVAPEQLHHKPQAGTWSVAENLQHLILVNESYFPIIKQMQEGAYKKPFLGKIKFLVKTMGDGLLKSVAPDRKKKMRTFKIWEPKLQETSNSILKQFEQQQIVLKSYIRSSADLLEQKAVLASPANENLVYSLQTAFDIMVSHEQRHLNQAIEALA